MERGWCCQKGEEKGEDAEGALSRAEDECAHGAHLIADPPDRANLASQCIGDRAASTALLEGADAARTLTDPKIAPRPHVSDMCASLEPVSGIGQCGCLGKGNANVNRASNNFGEMRTIWNCSCGVLNARAANRVGMGARGAMP
eukprot:scaffold52599_cov37-Tisochrysis_lutea.AAC.3